MLCRCHTSFRVKLAVVVTVSGTPCLPGPCCGKGLTPFLRPLPNDSIERLWKRYAAQATQTLACICMALSAATALVFLYFSAVLRCSRETHSGRYCFQLNFT